MEAGSEGQEITSLEPHQPTSYDRAHLVLITSWIQIQSMKSRDAPANLSVVSPFKF